LAVKINEIDIRRLQGDVVGGGSATNPEQ